MEAGDAFYNLVALVYIIYTSSYRAHRKEKFQFLFADRDKNLPELVGVSQ